MRVSLSPATPPTSMEKLGWSGRLHLARWDPIAFSLLCAALTATHSARIDCTLNIDCCHVRFKWALVTSNTSDPKHWVESTTKHQDLSIPTASYVSVFVCLAKIDTQTGLISRDLWALTGCRLVSTAATKGWRCFTYPGGALYPHAQCHIAHRSSQTRRRWEIPMWSWEWKRGQLKISVAGCLRWVRKESCCEKLAFKVVEKRLNSCKLRLPMSWRALEKSVRSESLNDRIEVDVNEGLQCNHHDITSLRLLHADLLFMSMRLRF